MNTHDPDVIRQRVRELEALCNDVLVAAVDFGLPHPLLNRLWAAVGHGQVPHAFIVDLPPKAAPVAPSTGGEIAAADAPPRADAATSAPGSSASDAIDGPGQPESLVPPAPRIEAASPMPLPDIHLTSNPLLSRTDGPPKPPQLDLKPLVVRKTVAVVDDDPMMLDVLERILQRENFDLLTASGGPEIIAKIEQHCGGVDLLITDYAMPEMQGRELAEHVRVRYPAVKVLYQTGFSDRLFENRVELEEGAAFLEKPFTARGLREAARLVLFGTLNPV